VVDFFSEHLLNLVLYLMRGFLKQFAKVMNFFTIIIYELTIKYGINFNSTKIYYVRPVEIALTIFIRGFVRN
jgi:hypothetical protein